MRFDESGGRSRQQRRNGLRWDERCGLAPPRAALPAWIVLAAFAVAAVPAAGASDSAPVPAVTSVADSTRPAPTARPASEIAVRLPADIVYRRTAGSDTGVVFSHATHFAAAGNLCTACHPRMFPLLKRGPAPTHAEMNAGRSCGTCHDGKQGFGVREEGACQVCHVSLKARTVAAAAPAPAGGTAATPPGRPLPPPHAYPPGADSPGRVTFKHATHQGVAGGCAACHPKLFKMMAERPRPGGGMHESSSCGSCHNGSKAFAAEDPEACARCHKQTGGGR